MVSTVEAALVGAVCGLTLEAAPAVLGALAVPPFIAEPAPRHRGMALALSAELVSLVTIALLTHGPLDPAQGTGTLTWVMTGVGVGLIGSFVHSAMPAPVDPLQPYRDAQALIRDLIGISGELTSGWTRSRSARRSQTRSATSSRSPRWWCRCRATTS